MSPSSTFHATLGYDSRMEGYEPAVDSSAQSFTGYRYSVSDFHQHAAKLSPVHMEQIMKVDWFGDVKISNFSLPSLLMLSFPQLLKMFHLIPFSHLSKYRLPHLYPFNLKQPPLPPSISSELPAVKCAGDAFNSGFQVCSVNGVQLSVVVWCPPVHCVCESLALSNPHVGKSHILAQRYDSADPVVTYPHVQYKLQNTNSSIDAATPWLSVRDGYRTFPDSNCSAAALVTSADDVQKQKKANSTVDVSLQQS